jgi:hypothetical protein
MPCWCPGASLVWSHVLNRGRRPLPFPGPHACRPPQAGPAVTPGVDIPSIPCTGAAVPVSRGGRAARAGPHSGLHPPSGSAAPMRIVALLLRSVKGLTDRLPVSCDHPSVGLPDATRNRVRLQRGRWAQSLGMTYALTKTRDTSAATAPRERRWPPVPDGTPGPSAEYQSHLRISLAYPGSGPGDAARAGRRATAPDMPPRLSPGAGSCDRTGKDASAGTCPRPARTRG